MSLKWTRNQSDSGILRKSESKEKKEELFVFGYSCKLFRDDDKALHIDQGKHLIPWMGDETLKIDRYDARGALHDLSALEAPPGGFDWRIELTKNEHDVEQLCDEERYRALHTDEDEEEMYKEEELKRLHAAGYGQVGFNYDAPAEPSPTSQTMEVDEPFEPTASFKALLPMDIVLPESLKQNAIIEKTAKFIASQGTQMEILIKAKQGDNPQFQFLVRDSVLHPYYMALIALVKSGKWPEKAPEVVEEKPTENEEYLHPSLASAVIESAPSIPSIHYKPSADCDYTMLISKMRGDTVVEEIYTQELAPGEVAPPGTEPLGVPARDHAQITRAPVMYHTDGAANPIPEQSHAAYQQYAAYYHQYLAQAAQAAQTAQTAQAAQLQIQPENNQPPTTLKSTGLSLMKNYNTDSESDDSDYDDTSSADSKEKQQILKPPEDIQIIIDKMASYVARNGDEFAEIVRAKNDPRFTFLDPEHMYHPYYKRLMQEKRGVDVNGKEKREKSKAPVSFSIKKMKEPDPILPKPALPYESSSDEDTEKSDKQTEKVEPTNESPKINAQIYQVQNIPQAVVYKMDGLLTQDLPSVRTIETVKTMPKIIQNPIQNVSEVIETPKEEVPVPVEIEVVQPEVPVVKEPTPMREEKKEKSPSPKKEKKRYKEKKKEYKLKSDSRESKRSERRSEEKEKRNEEKEKKKNKEGEDRDRKRSKYKDNLENEVITLEDNSDDLIDLTGDQSDSKGECETEAERAKQLERKRRVAEFLKKVGVDTPAAALPNSSLASAMVDTLELLRKKKAEVEEKKRRREKRRHRERRDYEDERSNRKSKRRKYNRSSDDDSDHDNSKKKKRKKDRKHNKSKRKRRREESEEEDQPLPANIDLTNTLKELRSASPTKELVLQEVEVQRQDSSEDDEKENTEEIKRKKEREYSEGEWSSDSEEDSGSDSYDINKKD